VKVIETELDGVRIFEPTVHGDARGHFKELFRAQDYGLGAFVQDNFARSVRGTLRGLHFQEPHPQGKLVMALAGAIFDVAVDIRRGSPTFGRHVAFELSDENHRQLWAPPGFAHGYCVLSETADVFYKCTAYYRAEHDRALAWNDARIGIRWPVEKPLLSPRDAAAPTLDDLFP
jgi:dTDP-4-dehydrorhamnose 3,5-epimerase